MGYCAGNRLWWRHWDRLTWKENDKRAYRGEWYQETMESKLQEAQTRWRLAATFGMGDNRGLLALINTIQLMMMWVTQGIWWHKVTWKILEAKDVRCIWVSNVRVGRLVLAAKMSTSKTNIFVHVVNEWVTAILQRSDFFRRKKSLETLHQL